MLHNNIRRPNPLRSASALLRAPAGLAFAFTLAAGIAAAQTPDSLPNAPQPQFLPLLQFAQTNALQSLLTPREESMGGKTSAASPVGHEPTEAPIIAMAPHSEDSLWWISGQANFILQGDLPFH